MNVKNKQYRYILLP